MILVRWFVGDELWQSVAAAVGCLRVARKISAITPDEFRSPNVMLLLGNDAWVEHIDNGIRFAAKIQTLL